VQRYAPLALPVLNLLMPLDEVGQARSLPGRFRSRLIAWLLLCLGGPALAGNFSVCVSDEAFPPFTYPRHESESQKLIRRAAERQGLRVEFVA